MKWNNRIIRPGDERVITFFAWLPTSVRGSTHVETRWLVRVCVRQRRLEGPGGFWWDNVAFADESPMGAACQPAGGKSTAEEPDMESEAMSLADHIVWQFQERLYDRASEVAKKRGSDLITVDDVVAASSNNHEPMLTDEDWTAIGVARAALMLSDGGACEQEIAILNRLLDGQGE